MSALLGVCAAGLLGLAVGTALERWWAQRRHTRAADPDIALTDADRDAIEAEFRIHAQTVAGQVTRFGDELAGNDVVLRERLRRVEAHVGRGC